MAIIRHDIILTLYIICYASLVASAHLGGADWFNIMTIFIFFGAFAFELMAILHKLYSRAKWPLSAIYIAAVAIVTVLSKAGGQNILADNIVGPLDLLPLSKEFAQLISFMFHMMLVWVVLAFFYNIYLSAAFLNEMLHLTSIIRVLSERFRIIRKLRIFLRIPKKETKTEAYRQLSTVMRFLTSFVYVAIFIKMANPEESRLYKWAEYELVGFAYHDELIGSHTCNLPIGSRITYGQGEKIYIGTLEEGKLHLKQTKCEPIHSRTKPNNASGSGPAQQ
jgi:hypothetical protein